ncbi:MAG: hypothetical protein RI907_18 [Pseudomonadota bacterium]|jgi:uncharacterized protein YbjT (DUF2867 family)
MRILLCGASGFIGHRLAQALTLAGHEVIPATSGRGDGGKPVTGPIVDYTQDTDPAVWMPRLRGVDLVINAVGVLRDTSSRPIQAIHADTPKALFSACAEAGVPKVLQVSALGVTDSQTAYARTKLAADTHLLGLAEQGALQAAILRPSVVFGHGGASSQLFMGLSYSPVLCLPEPVIRAKVQPVAVHDLAEAVLKLVPQDWASVLPGRVLHAVGAEALTMADLVSNLRQQLGHSRSWVMSLPGPLTTLSARIGDMLPWMPWCTETMAMLASDNVADVTDFTRILGHTPTHYSQLVATAWQTA